MAYVIAHADAKLATRYSAEQKGDKYSYFNFPDDPDLPHASSNGHTGNRIGPAHFHVRDQFQVVVDGRFKIGRHKLSPYCVHFARAYTPYGPLVPEGDYTFVVMRAHRDAGPQYLSREMEQLRAVRDRKPWQISQKVDFPPLAARGAADVIVQPVPEIADDKGLAVYTLILKPNVTARAPDATLGDGQYLLVTKGSFWYENKEQRALALVFIKPEERAFEFRAGAEGLEAIVLNFPQVGPRSDETKAPAKAPGARKWQCALCAFAYDEALGMPGEGIPAGTRWEDVPETWSCPDCSATKSDFQMVEVA